MKTEPEIKTETDPVFRGGATLLILGVIVIGAIVYVFFRPSTNKNEPPPTIPITNISDKATIYELVPGESGVRFTLGELLRGQPVTVIGANGLVSGQIGLDWNDAANAQMGVIQANARSFYTDDIFRDEALHAWIISSQEFPLVAFAPTNIDGLPEKIGVGEKAVFTIAGDLTIRDITQRVTFEATAVPISPTRLEGQAAATINRADFDLIIPNVPKVANVDEAVLIEIEFAATAVE
ncbi:MAG: YceI family protein [Chloroflexi bacterium]|nr:YceI family protein [Chloroflexota bacterium]